MKAETLMPEAQVVVSSSLIKRSKLILISLQKVALRAEINTCNNALALAVDEYVNCVPKRESLNEELFYFSKFIRYNLPIYIEIQNKDKLLFAAERILQR